MKQIFTLILAGCALAALAATPPGTGRLAGQAYVGGGSAGIVAGAEVIAEADGTILRTTTDREGRFAFEDVPEGRYALTARHPDYAPYTVHGVRVAAAMTSEVDLRLHAE